MVEVDMVTIELVVVRVSIRQPKSRVRRECEYEDDARSISKQQ